MFHLLFSKRNSFVFLLAVLSACTSTQNEYVPLVITDDITHFWAAYDQIAATTDTALQRQLLQTEFLDKGTPGLTAIREVRRYTADDYLLAIRTFPKFWASIRPNMERVPELSTDIEQGIDRLRDNYPNLRSAKLYFTVGAFRTGGTTLDSLVLIGSEISLADEHTHTEEFTENMSHLPGFFQTNPSENLVFLNVHEYIHTQQRNALSVNLLAQSLREGVAEFVAVKVLEQKSPNASIIYGLAHDEAVKQQFQREMFNQYYSYWLWSNLDNPFEVRDLGYYPGYAIAQKYYAAATDKQAALQTLIELDYADPTAVEQLVEETAYFAQPITELRATYAAERPTVLGLQEIENGSQSVKPGLQTITVQFSTPMDTRFRGFDYGPLGEDNVLRISEFIGFAADGRSVSFRAELLPNRRYQMLLPGRFRDLNGLEIAPYLIDVRTGE